MKQFIYRSYNKLAKYFYKPIIIDATPDEYKEAYHRSILTETDDRKLAAIQDFRISCIGEYDDNSGKIDIYPEPIDLFDVQDMLKEREQDGKEERIQSPSC